MEYYIKQTGNRVTLGSLELTAGMEAEGYFKYTGTLPSCPEDFWIWDDEQKLVVENTTRRKAVELKVVRRNRNERLAACDWIVSKYAEKLQPIPEEWATYRQALRDITTTFVNLDTLVWPEAPTTT